MLSSQNLSQGAIAAPLSVESSSFDPLQPDRPPAHETAIASSSPRVLGVSTRQTMHRIVGTGGSDRLVAPNRATLVLAKGGDDHVLGRGGDDILKGGRGNDRLNGGAGNDRLEGGSGNDILIGGTGDDVLNGGRGNDRLKGGKGDDTLNGGSGNDILIGGPGKNILTGGSGRDTFVLSLRHAGSLRQADEITDFSPGRDRLKLQGRMQFEDLELIKGRGNNTGSTLVRHKDSGNYLAILTGVTAKQLQSRDAALRGASLPGFPGRFSFTTPRYTVNENAGTVTITVTRTGGSTGAAQVAYRTIGRGTATPGVDYIATSGVLSFADGQTNRRFTIQILDDDLAEPDKTVRIELINPSEGAELGTKVATLTIIDDDVAGSIPPAVSIQTSDVTKFTPTSSQAAIAALNGPSVTIGTQTIYIGTWQRTSINQDPIIASFDSANPANNWVRTNYESTGADGRGYGLFWDGTHLYGVFSVDGTQGTSSEDFRRVANTATQTWLRSYGQGGGAKIGVLARINPATGEMTTAAHLSARLSNGNSNTLVIKDMFINSNNNLVVRADSWFSPRNPDGSAMTQVGSGGSPHDYTVEITRDLRTVISTSAVGWVA
ncbi:MAG: hypothetical protein EA367_12345 [Leptolyngbya sp. DLM2.Bin15]|nr:MAG: hypothetical protein EA367_12345 [Leptolyngbya sp. DLM2.Bin15]